MPTTWRFFLPRADISSLLTLEDQRAISAATAVPAVALASWIDLLHECSFHDISPNTQRLTPMIYRNLKNAEDVPERAKLRGSYRYSWSKNQRLMHSMGPVFAEFNRLEINYRVIKGIAIQLTLDFLGARVVGDIDIVVSQSEIDGVRQVLEQHGFRCNSVSACGRHPVNAPHDALNFNRGENHVDVHIAERKYPLRLLSEMIASDPIIKSHMGTAIPIPPTPLLLLHSAFHGQLASSDTDLVQAIVDIELLSLKCDPRELTALAHRTQTTSDLWSRNTPSGDLEKSGGVNQLLNTQRPRLHKVLMAPAIMRDRFRGFGTSAKVLREFPGRKYSYALWLTSGQFANIERKLRIRERGFLPEPSVVCPPGSWIAPFDEEGSELVRGTNMAPSTLDYRFTIRIPARVRDLKFTLHSNYLDSVDSFLFANGSPITRIVAGDMEHREVHVRSPLEVNEISIRSRIRVCGACFDGLTDLKVRVEYEAP